MNNIMQELPHESYLYYRKMLVEMIKEDTQYLHANYRDWEITLHQIISRNRDRDYYFIEFDEETNRNPLERRIKNAILQTVIAFLDAIVPFNWDRPAVEETTQIIRLLYCDLFEIFTNLNEIKRDFYLYTFVDNLHLYIKIQHTVLPPLIPIIENLEDNILEQKLGGNLSFEEHHYDNYVHYIDEFSEEYHRANPFD